MPDTVLITGTSSGVGLAAVEAVAARGAQVVATVRSADDAAMVEARMALLGLEVTTALLDVTDADRCAEVIDEHRPDVLVNNAGAAPFAPLMDVADDDATDLLELLTVAPARLARLAAEHMRKGEGGRIVDVGSALGVQSVPLSGWYSAAKAATSSLAETMRMELAGDGIEVVRVELGAVDTAIWDDTSEGLDGDHPRFTRFTKALRPLFSDVTVAADTIAEAALTPRPRALYRAGLGTAVLAAAAHAPARVRDPFLKLLLG
jgi:short-subunit dehydrogenase